MEHVFRAVVGFWLLVLAVPWAASADPVTLQEVLFNVNDTTYGDTVVPGLDSSGFDIATGLGTLVLTFNPGVAGADFVDVFFDHELHAPFFDESGSVAGAPDAGISWQIDEPELGSDLNRAGTIFSNTVGNALDNTNHVPGSTSNFFNDCGANGGGPVDATCNNDVALAMGFNFILAANEQAVLTLTIGQLRPQSGFYLQQHDPDSLGNDIFLAGAIDRKTTSTVPEPDSLCLLGAGLIAMARRVRRNRAVTR